MYLVIFILQILLVGVFFHISGYLRILFEIFKYNFGITINKIYPSIGSYLEYPPKPHNLVRLSLESCPIKKPGLKLETKPASTGNEGLDREMEWRKKSGNCEHTKTFNYVADENDLKDPLLCDMANDENEALKPTKVKEMFPEKHPAVKNVGDVAKLCDYCHMVICKDCEQHYSSSENTPIAENFPESTDNASSNDNPVQDNFQKSTDNASSNDNPVQDNLPESTGNANTATSTSTSKPSLLDDFADASCELPDYTGGDD